MVPEDLDCIEEESEHQRIAKAVRRIIRPKVGGSGAVAFPRARVLVTIPSSAGHSLVGQRMLSMVLNQLLRFKSVVAEVAVLVDPSIAALPGVPIAGTTLGDLTERLAASLSGPQSSYVIPARINPSDAADYHVSLGLCAPPEPALPEALWIDADAWTGFVNAPAPRPDPMAALPFGAYLAASLGVAEVFKRLLRLNYGADLGRPIQVLDQTGLSALDYSVGLGTRLYPEMSAEINIGKLVVAGAGAGGSAALYTLASIQDIQGEVDIVDPQTFGVSNLSRYLMTTYSDVYGALWKAPYAAAWVSDRQPRLQTHPWPSPYAEYRNVVGGSVAADMLLSTVDTAEIRREIQDGTRSIIGDAAVAEGLYTVLVVYYGRGRCLLCKHPYDGDSLMKKAARRWGQSLCTVRQWSEEHHLITEEDARHVAKVRRLAYEDLAPQIVGKDFADLWRLVECGAAAFELPLPDQAPTLPFLTTVPGVLLAAEVVKHATLGPEARWNCWEHDLLATPLGKNRRWRSPLRACRCRSEN